MTERRRDVPPEYVFYLQYHVARQRELVLARHLEPLGLTMPKWRILLILDRLGRSSMGQVADFCGIDRTTLTRTVDQLVAAGMVERVGEPADRRQTLMALTPAGLAAYRSALEAVMAFNMRALQGVEADEVRVLTHLLRKVVRNVIEDPDWAESILRFEKPSRA